MTPLIDKAQETTLHIMQTNSILPPQPQNSDYRRRLTSDGDGFRLPILYTLLLFFLVVAPACCYFKGCIEDRQQARRRREQRAASEAAAAEAEEEARAARKTQKKEKRARVLQLVAPVQMVR
jgi:hypothetical protein